MRRIPYEYPIYDYSYKNDMPIEQCYLLYFDLIPSSLSEQKMKYNEDVIKYIFDLGFVIEQDMTTTGKRTNSTSYMVKNFEKHMMIRIDKSYNEKMEFKGVSLDFLYDINLGNIKEQLDFEELYKFLFISKKSNIKLVKQEHSYLDTEDYDLVCPEINMDLNYGSEFKKIHETILTRLNNPLDKGIILLHGEPGTGKTMYLKYLTNQIKDKDILFIPPSMAEALSEPTIIPFLMDNKNSVLLIEDAEKVIGDRKSGNVSSTGVSNILNITDGILGDCLNIQIIATFNMSKERIDKALLRKGRLIVEHKFDALNVEDSNKLLKHLGKKHETKIPLTLADIYNIEEDDMRSTKDVKIGFKND